MTLKNFSFLWVGVLLLAGCATNPKPIKTVGQEVKTVVGSCPAPAQTPEPQLLTKTLVDKDVLRPGYVAQLYVADVLQLLGIIEQQKKVIDKYAEIAKGNP